MVIRAVVVLYALMALGAAVVVPLRDPAYSAWADYPVIGALAVIHAVLALILTVRLGGRAPGQWLALTFALVAQGCTVWVVAFWAPLRTDAFEIFCLCSVGLAGGTMAYFAQLNDPSVARRDGVGPAGLSWWLHFAPLVLSLAVVAAYLLAIQVGYPFTGELIVFSWLALSLAAAARHLWRGQALSEPGARARIRWAVLASVLWALGAVAYLGLLFSVLFDVPGDPWGIFRWAQRNAESLAALSVIVGSTLLVYGMLSAGTIDPGFAIRKTTVFGGLGVLFIFVLAGSGNLVENWLESTLGMPGGIGTMLTGGTLAVVLLPAKRRLDGVMGRLVPGDDAPLDASADATPSGGS